MSPTLETVLKTTSDRVKCVDFHPEKPFLLAGLHSGDVQVWDYETKELVKSIKVGDKPVRAVKFIPRMNWIVVGSDDGLIRIFSFVHFELLRQFAAHSDFIRSLAVHPTLPFVISASDDKTVKVWNWASDWKIEETFEGHGHYVMHVTINPHATGIVASASLDKTVKIWQLGAERADPLKTLGGHSEGVNCVVFQEGSRVVTGSDDRKVKVWDWKEDDYSANDVYQHDHNVTCILENGSSNRIVSGSEDGSLKVWTENDGVRKFDFEGSGRVWSIAEKEGLLCIGCDNGLLVFKL